MLIDDYASELKNGEVLKLLNTLVNNHRHLRLAVRLSVQTYKSIPLRNRKTIYILVMFKCMNKAEIKEYGRDDSLPEKMTSFIH